MTRFRMTRFRVRKFYVHPGGRSVWEVQMRPWWRPWWTYADATFNDELDAVWHMSKLEDDHAGN